MEDENKLKPCAIVTGASSGIGEAIAARLLKMGYLVYGLGRDFEKSELLMKPDFFALSMNLEKTQLLIEKIKEIRKKEKVMILVNAAGVGYYGLHEEMKTSWISEMTRVNLEVPMILSNLLLRPLKENHGTILQISSVTAEKTNPHGCAYGATKAGLTNFSESLFEEARKYGVRVCILEPDLTKTNLYRNADFNVGETQDTYLLSEEVADAAEFVLSRREGMNIEKMIIRPQRHGLSKNKDGRKAEEKISFE